MTETPQGYVSVIGLNLLQPIVELAEKLRASHPTEPNEVQTGQYENGYACALVVLSVLVLESAINRTKYVRKDEVEAEIITYLTSLLSDSDLVHDVDEVIAIRDAVVHNHLWQAKVYWDSSSLLKFSGSPERLAGYGNQRLHRVMDPKTRLTRRLGLNLFPPRIWRRDAFAVLNIVIRVLRSLEAIEPNYFYISNQHFVFHGELQTLSSIVKYLSR